MNKPLEVDSTTVTVDNDVTSKSNLFTDVGTDTISSVSSLTVTVPLPSNLVGRIGDIVVETTTTDATLEITTSAGNSPVDYIPSGKLNDKNDQLSVLPVDKVTITITPRTKQRISKLRIKIYGCFVPSTTSVSTTHEERTPPKETTPVTPQPTVPTISNSAGLSTSTGISKCSSIDGMDIPLPLNASSIQTDTPVVSLDNLLNEFGTSTVASNVDSLTITVKLPSDYVGRIGEIVISTTTTVNLVQVTTHLGENLVDYILDAKANSNITNFGDKAVDTITIFLSKLNPSDRVPFEGLKLKVYGCFALSTTPFSTIKPETTVTTSSSSVSTTSSFSTCNLSEWGSWSPCSNECGVSEITRSRTLLSGYCSEPLTEIATCSNVQCSCQFSDDVIRALLNRPIPSDLIIGFVNLGNDLDQIALSIGDSVSKGTTVQLDNCTAIKCDQAGLVVTSQNCSSDCKWSEWNSWHECIGGCTGQGIRYRSRTKVAEAIGSGAECVGDYYENEPCTDCYHCSVTEWSAWTECTKSCGVGEKTRVRSFLSANSSCTDTLEETVPCNTDCCPVEGVWSPWGEWSNCTAECNSGSRKRTRTCDWTTKSCATECPGKPVEYQSCNTQPCNEECENGKVFNECSNSCDMTCSTLTCTQQCQQPDECKPGCTCPEGYVENYNGTCVKSSDCSCRVNGTEYAPGQTIEKDCETCKCVAGCMQCTPKECNVCQLSSWSEWSRCTNNCNGVSYRYRNYYGVNCNTLTLESNDDVLTESRTCTDCSCVADGVSYPEGATFGNPFNTCETCKCVEGMTKCYPNCNGTDTRETCQEKSNDEFVYTWVEPKAGECCGFCNKTKRAQDKCDVVRSRPRFYQAANCISVKPVVDSFCGGSCYSHESNRFKFRKLIMGEKECRCCGADKVEEEQVEMKCRTDNGFQYETATLYKILTCKCHHCKEKNGSGWNGIASTSSSIAAPA